MLDCGIGLLQVCLSFVSLMCSRGAVVAMSRSMQAIVSLDDRFGSSVYVICLFDVFLVTLSWRCPAAWTGAC